MICTPARWYGRPTDEARRGERLHAIMQERCGNRRRGRYRCPCCRGDDGSGSFNDRYRSAPSRPGQYRGQYRASPVRDRHAPHPPRRSDRVQRRSAGLEAVLWCCAGSGEHRGSPIDRLRLSKSTRALSEQQCTGCKRASCSISLSMERSATILFSRPFSSPTASTHRTCSSKRRT